MDDDYAKQYPCVRCGYCCTRGPCIHGGWDSERQRCSCLTEDNLCELYEEIKEKQKDDPFPLFGCGCSSPLFNDVREARIRDILDLEQGD